jgi:hypothetical protein
MWIQCTDGSVVDLTDSSRIPLVLLATLPWPDDITPIVPRGRDKRVGRNSDLSAVARRAKAEGCLGILNDS